MKIYIITMLVSLIGLSGLNAQKAVDNFQIQVDGLGCPFCAYGLEKKFKEFKGIKKVSIQIETGVFKFTYPSEKALTMDAVVSQVKKAGYTPQTAKIIRANGKQEVFSATSKQEAKGATVKGSMLVKGNCEMCKYRIEAAALNTGGVQNAFWNVETKILDIDFLDQKTSINKVAKNIANEGHDSELLQAQKEVYDGLPLCCAYRNPNAKIH